MTCSNCKQNMVLGGRYMQIGRFRFCRDCYGKRREVVIEPGVVGAYIADRAIEKNKHILEAP